MGSRRRSAGRSSFALVAALAFVFSLSVARWAFSVPMLHTTRTGLLVSGSFADDASQLPGRRNFLEIGAGASSEQQLSSVSQSTVNLVKNIMGAGMLSLPAGVAAFSGSKQALIPAITFTVLLGLLSAYGFILIADACRWTKETTYADAWAKTVGPKTKIIPASACLAKAAVGCISYSMILGDCVSLILQPLGLPPIISSRSSAMIGVTVAVLYPLCNMKSLAPLAKFSVLGVLSNVYICGFILLRWLDGSYATGGAMLSAAPALPKFVAASGSAWSACASPGITVLLSILATAFLAHYNAPMYYEQLDPGANDDKEGRFKQVSIMGFVFSGVIFSLVMLGGFLTFGANSSGLILNSYAATDNLALIARLAICCSLITAYPLVFLSLRKQVLGVMGDSASVAESRPKLTTLVFLSCITAVALKLHNLGKLAAFAGAAFGSFLIYVAPALMVLSAKRGAGATAVGKASLSAMILIGVSLGILGSIQSLK